MRGLTNDDFYIVNMRQEEKTATIAAFCDISYIRVSYNWLPGAIRSMCNLYKKTAPEVTYGEANFEICPIAFYFTLFGNDIIRPI